MVAVVATLAAGCQASKSGSNSPDPEGDGSSGGAASSEAGAPVSGGPTSDDAPYHEAVSTEFVDGGYMFRDLVAQIALSEPFRLRRGRTPE